MVLTGFKVIQKLFEHGTGPQKAAMIAAMESHILQLSLHMYGCRVVQKVRFFVLLTGILHPSSGRKRDRGEREKRVKRSRPSHPLPRLRHLREVARPAVRVRHLEEDAVRAVDGQAEVVQALRQCQPRTHTTNAGRPSPAPGATRGSRSG